MKQTTLFSLLAGPLCALMLAASASAAIVTFGSGGNEFNIEFVEIGSPNNDDDIIASPVPAGSVPYIYHMGKFEVSEDMITKANTLGNLAITLADMTSFGGNGINRPATGVSWNEAARFVNWLNVSQNFAPAYKFALQPGDGGYDSNAGLQPWILGDAGYNATNPFRNSQANYFLPSFDEWHKAAYFDPNTNTYFVYPVGTNAPPTPTAGSTDAGTAVYYDQIGPADITNAGGLSPFGVMGMGANVSEWEETNHDLDNNEDDLRGHRGGFWALTHPFMSSSFRFSEAPTSNNSIIGFRVASLSPVPEPSICVLVMMVTITLGVVRWKWFQKNRSAV